MKAASASVTSSDLFSTSGIMCARVLLTVTALLECWGEQSRELWVPQLCLTVRKRMEMSAGRDTSWAAWADGG